jgi:hypothetical protein
VWLFHYTFVTNGIMSLIWCFLSLPQPLWGRREGRGWMSVVGKPWWNCGDTIINHLHYSHKPLWENKDRWRTTFKSLTCVSKFLVSMAKLLFTLKHNRRHPLSKLSRKAEWSALPFLHKHLCELQRGLVDGIHLANTHSYFSSLLNKSIPLKRAVWAHRAIEWGMI